MPGVWLLKQVLVRYDPLVCTFASRRSYGHAAAPSCASASSSLMIPSTAMVEPRAQSKSATALLTISVAFVGSSIRPTGTAAGVSTSSRSLELQAAIAVAATMAAIETAVRRALPRKTASATCMYVREEIIGEFRPLLGSGGSRSIAQANREHDCSQLRQMGLIQVYRNCARLPS